MKTKIIILGDLYPKTVNEFPTLPHNDFCVANLECAITDAEKAILKDGPSLKISTSKVCVLKKLGINLVGLANNHVMDYGLEGLRDTISVLRNNEIEFGGCSLGENYVIKEINGIKFGFYFVSEHQYNRGINVLEEKRNLDEIRNLQKGTDFVIVLFHGGKEYYKFPTPLQQSICHKFVDSGADFVVCQHSHCVGCKETYNDSEIIYGQGNFVFPFSKKEDFKTGIVIQLEFDGTKNHKTTFIPIVHLEKDIIRYANNNESESILTDFESCTMELSDKNVDTLFNDMVQDQGLDFLYRLFNKSRFFVRLDTSRFLKNKLLKRYIKKNKRYILYLYNYFNCETHSEYIKAVLARHAKLGIKQ